MLFSLFFFRISRHFAICLHDAFTAFSFILFGRKIACVSFLHDVYHGFVPYFLMSIWSLYIVSNRSHRFRVTLIFSNFISFHIRYSMLYVVTQPIPAMCNMPRIRCTHAYSNRLHDNWIRRTMEMKEDEDEMNCGSSLLVYRMWNPNCVCVCVSIFGPSSSLCISIIFDEPVILKIYKYWRWLGIDDEDSKTIHKNHINENVYSHQKRESTNRMKQPTAVAASTICTDNDGKQYRCVIKYSQNEVQHNLRHS